MTRPSAARVSGPMSRICVTSERHCREGAVWEREEELGQVLPHCICTCVSCIPVPPNCRTELQQPVHPAPALFPCSRGLTHHRAYARPSHSVLAAVA